MLDSVVRVLKQSNMLSYKLPELMPGGFFVATDVTCREIVHNPVSARFYRIEAWKSLSSSSSPPPQFKVYRDGRLVKPEELPIQRATWLGEEVTGEEYELIWPDGISKVGIFNASPLRNDSGEIIGSICTFDDVTQIVHMKRELNAHRLHLQRMVEERTEELKREFEKRETMEREVAKLERLNVIGQLAAGLGHEVRNPLTTIRGFLQMLQSKTDLHTYKGHFDLMIEELDRTNSIITDFLSLAKNKPTELKRQCLNKLLANLFPLLEADAYTQGKKCVFEPGDLPNLDINTNEIIQLVLNFARNGLEAMPLDGCLTINTFMEGQNIVLSFKDEGTGIKLEDVLKLGISFFTTKENGTGLGLPMCYSIADRHNAQIELTTGPDGTTFFVRFPKPLEVKTNP
ncbi:ATP-binding protein [Desulfosporosinus sp. OT]|uniref:ATP-binding protein n=1 Tax=Desulfosporosinus sp. OT TaxID=913865 RepID=UPI0006807A1D|nr:ATP-binding protein [Desulfosporosinus sp. OT]